MISKMELKDHAVFDRNRGGLVITKMLGASLKSFELDLGY